MSIKDLRGYIALLKSHDLVQEIEQEVHWNLEVGAIIRLVCEKGLPSPYFKKIKGYSKDYQIFGAPLSSMRKVALAFGVAPDTSAKELMEIYIKRKKNLIKPIIVKDAPCKENIIMGDDVNLLKFPAPMLHDGDGGRYLCTYHATITKDLNSGWVNWGMYRAMIQDKKTLGGLMDAVQHIGYHYHRGYEPEGIPMPFAIAIGVEPLVGMIASTKIPYSQCEADLIGALKGEPVELVKCETNDLLVPATAEIVIEGEVPPKERMWEGPFGEFTGYRASPRDKRPIYKVKAITHRNNPILTSSCMGMPIDDCAAPGEVTGGAEFLSHLREQGVPVVDLCVFKEACHFIIAVSVKATFSNIAQRVAHTIWGKDGGGPPYVIVLQDDVDPHNMAAVFHALGTKCHPYRGIRRDQYSVGFPLMPFLSRHERLNFLGAQVYFDCTWPLDWDPSIAVPPRASFDSIYPKEVQNSVLQNWEKYGFKKLS